MNTETKSEKSSAETAAAPLWKYVTKLEKASVGGGNVAFRSNNNLAGYIPPGYNKLRTTLLQKERAHIEKLLRSIKDTWKEKGLSIVSDGWTDVQKRPLINFMATSEKEPLFIKSIDGTKEYKDKRFIADLFLKVIGEVRHQHVVQIITDNASVMKAAGSIIEAKYPHIFWAPCVVHTLNLALRNICAPKNSLQNEVAYNECNWIAQVSDEATFIRIFITNHSMRLAIFNSYSPLKLLAVVETRFASIIIILKRLFQVAYILRFTGPIYEMLQVADTDAPILNKLYEMWDSMIENVKKEIYEHEGKEDYEESPFYDVVLNMLIERRRPEYITGESKKWDIGGDNWDEPFGGPRLLEIAYLRLDEPEMETSIVENDDYVDDDDVVVL
ncbi:uncharacterized protein LOC115961638 [Quercus lobata]|uniref:uncharacterized protein LOC115961638 n=1 Tax=Quercus lobata TaxID=97700 RepID=UPI0012461B44|nr:uncharacterized protein LOC115961638 [Quercus lobata]